MDNLKKAEGFVEGMDFDDFLEDEKTRYSVICALEIVGEAIKKVPIAIRQKNPEVIMKLCGKLPGSLLQQFDP